MLRRSCTSLGVVFCRVVDNSRFLEEGGHFTGVFPSQIDLGPGVNEMKVGDFQKLVDEWAKKQSVEFDSCLYGKVHDRFKNRVESVRAGERYIVTAKMAHGYFHKDPKLRKQRMTGSRGGLTRRGYNWFGDDV